MGGGDGPRSGAVAANVRGRRRAAPALGGAPEVGLFDERFFLYAEETDWQRRAADRGWSLRGVRRRRSPFTPAQERASDPPRRESLFHAAQETYIRKWHGSLGLGGLPGRCACSARSRERSLLTGERRAGQPERAHLLYARGPRRSAAARPGVADAERRPRDHDGRSSPAPSGT